MRNGGSRILKNFRYSKIAMLRKVYPDHDWKEWKFEFVPKRCWDDEKNRREYLNWLGPQIGVNDLQDWYKISAKMVADKGGGGLMRIFGDNISSCLMATFTDHKWYPFLFNRVSKHHSRNEKQEVEFAQWLSTKFKIQSLEEWYRLSNEMLQKNNENQHHR
eukprot:TRINITY_DN14902_c0_g1_i1.p1 TRINITY_DN14902_c0_g1~~TRINITY_DN14902_c0_g1_i1.p1  ORF type:complete len:169 (-),score=35.67 TRINITY_DN14902_c0_g1_i1:2-484(-)